MEKTYHLFLIKTFNKPGREGGIISIKYIYYEPTTNIFLYGGKLNVSHQKEKQGKLSALVSSAKYFARGYNMCNARKNKQEACKLELRVKTFLCGSYGSLYRKSYDTLKKWVELLSEFSLVSLVKLV